MNFQEFENKIIDTLAKYIRDKDQNGRYFQLVLGAYEEGGEVSTIIRKATKGNYHEKPIDLEYLKEEIGDVFFYITQITHQLPNVNIVSVVESSLENENGDNEIELEEDELTIRKYQQRISNTYGKHLPESKEERAIAFALGLIGGMSGVTALFRNYLLKGQKLDTDNIKIELGECLKNAVALSENYGLDFQEIAEAAIEKARSRYDKNGIAKVDNGAEAR